MKWELTSSHERQSGVDAGQEIYDLLRRLNLEDISPLCAQRSRRHHSEIGEYEEQCVLPDSVYGHLRAALVAVLRQLGVEDTESAVEGLHCGRTMQDVVGIFGKEG